MVILLAGYNTSSADVPGVFSQVVSDVTSRLGYVHTVRFSYSFPTTYSAGATYTALPSLAVDALHRTVASELLRCPDAPIYLIGHSLGGVVALRYVALYGAVPEGAHIRHVITLDSPVNGTSHDRLVFAASALDERRLVGRPTGVYLAAQHRDHTLRAANVALAARLAPQTLITTLASTDDWIVPAGDATIAGYSRQFHLGRNYAACTRGLSAVPSCLGHDRVLHSATALAAMRSALSR
jgi:pimeloyl-ACP methyl ester carboxylesterase